MGNGKNNPNSRGKRHMRKPLGRGRGRSRSRRKTRATAKKMNRSLGRKRKQRLNGRKSIRQQRKAAAQNRKSRTLSSDWKRRKSLAVVLMVCNEAKSLPGILHELKRLSPDEIIIVVNGSSDKSFEVARADPKAVVLDYPQVLGHDVGRAIGAKLVRSDICLFLDGDIHVRAEELVPFIRAVDGGADAALNDLSPFIGSFFRWDPITRIKALLNRALGLKKLRMNSLTAVPNVLSRRAIETIGPAALAVPPLAQTKLVLSGLHVCAPASINVIKRNKLRPSNTGEGNTVESLIIGDHLEALNYLLGEQGQRGVFADHIRRRSLLDEKEDGM